MFASLFCCLAWSLKKIDPGVLCSGSIAFGGGECTVFKMCPECSVTALPLIVVSTEATDLSMLSHKVNF